MAGPIFDLCAEYVRRAAALDPVWATFVGIQDHGGAASDFGPEGNAARAELVRTTLGALAVLTPVGADEIAAAAHLRERLEATRAWNDADEPLRHLRAPFGPLSFVRDSVELLTGDDPDSWGAVAQRLSAVPAMLAGWRASLALGLDRGLPAARRQAIEAAAQADRYAGHNSVPPTFDSVIARYGDGPLRESLAAAAARGHAAYADTARYLREEYAPRAVEADGVGPERHAVASRLTLGADVDPDEAYQWGWAELHRIEDELAMEADRVRSGATIDEAIAVLDETMYVDGTHAYEGWLQEQHDQAIDRLDGRHFDIAPPLRRVQVTLARGSSSGSAYYTPPSEDLTRPGRTWWPLAGRERFVTWNELTTVFHEGVPGHHLQLGQARAVGDRLSRFTRVTQVPGHSEGWALYAERLADELGWHATPGHRLGMLKASALRAARVVIDLGIHLDLPLPPAEAARHGPRWTFASATEVLRDRGRIAAHRLHPEVVRYCGWPAQATAYKLGERAWLAARDEARRRGGAAFDLKDWHTRALSLGPIGLDGLAPALRALDR
jgi:uncharacterized protein (DUF885 family)